MMSAVMLNVVLLNVVAPEKVDNYSQNIRLARKNIRDKHSSLSCSNICKKMKIFLQQDLPKKSQEQTLQPIMFQLQ